MTNIRIKDLTAATPAGTESVPFDSASPGTRQNTITNVVDVGNQTISNPIIGVATSTNTTTVRTSLTVSGNLLVYQSASFGTTINNIGPNAVVYISGALNTLPTSINQKYLVVASDAVFSGTIMMKSSSANPVNYILGGNGDGGLVFSGSLLSIASLAGTQMGGLSGQGAVIPIGQKDTIFFMSGTIGGKDGSSRSIALAGGDFAVSGNFYAFKSASFTDTIIVPTPATGTAAANKDYVDTPAVRLVTGSTDTLLTTDFGKVVAYTVTGAVNININNSLTASFPANKDAIILLQFENSASAPFLSSSGGVTLNTVTTTYTASIGPGLISIASRNGLNWWR